MGGADLVGESVGDLAESGVIRLTVGRGSLSRSRWSWSWLNSLLLAVAILAALVFNLLLIVQNYVTAVAVSLAALSGASAGCSAVLASPLPSKNKRLLVPIIVGLAIAVMAFLLSLLPA